MSRLPGFDAVPALMVPGMAWPGEPFIVTGSPAPASTSRWLWYGPVPGMAVPGMFSPGFTGCGAPVFYLFTGHVPGYYLDYLDVSVQRTLFAVPGCWYAMIAVNTRAGLTVPPPDYRGVASPIHFGLHAPDPGRARRERIALLRFRAAQRQASRPEHAALTKAMTAARLAALSRAPGVPQPRQPDGPWLRPAIIPAPPPDPVLAAGRAHSAARHAAIARGEDPDGR